MKVDGCGDQSYYPVGYRKFGDALQASGRDIIYSCSWPAYLGDDEAQKPFATFIESGCNVWRNFIDMGRECRFRAHAAALTACPPAHMHAHTTLTENPRNSRPLNWQRLLGTCRAWPSTG